MRGTEGEKFPTVKYKDGFLYLLKRSNWKLVIPEGFKINGKSAPKYLINEAHVNTGHGALDKTYQELTQHYTWQNSFSNTQEFVKSCEICQLIKGSTQKPVGLLTPVNVPTKPWDSIAMDFISMKPVLIPCSKVIAGFKDPEGDNPYILSFHKLLGISYRHSGYTFLILCISEIIAQGVIDIFTNWIKLTVGYPNSLVTNQDPLFISKLFPA